MKLYEIADQLQTLEAIMDTDFAETEDEKSAMLEAVEQAQLAFADKLEAVAKVRANLMREAEAIKAEEERLAKRRKANERRADWLKDYVEYSMQVAGQQKVKTELFSFNIQNNPPSVYVANEALVPGDYLLPQPAKVDKRRILEALKAGEEVPGCAIEQTHGVRIR
jgi:hypothetical protein